MAGGGVTILQPFKGKPGNTDWYKGTAHAIYKNISFIRNKNPEEVIILSGDHVYEMDYSKMIEFHRSKGANLTIAAQPVDYNEASRFGILDHQEDMKVTNFLEKPDHPPSNLASMGIYVFKTEKLLEVLKNSCSDSNSDFGHHIIPPMIDNDEVYLYRYEDYWKDVGTLESYWQTNLDLAKSIPELNLYSEDWKLYTRSEEKPPAKFGRHSKASCSLISNGAIINGEVEIKENCRVYSYVEEEHFQNNNIPSGSTITSEFGEKITTGDEEQIEELNK